MAAGDVDGMPGPVLDRSGPTWRGSLPGLGSLLVAPDGALTILPADRDPAGEQAAALRHGWGDLLAHARRGFAMASGAAMVPGDPSLGALLVCGDAHDVATVVLWLSRRDWLLLSDRPTPTQWQGGRLVAHPRSAPLVMARQRAVEAGAPHAPIRAQSNSVAVDIPRSSAPAPIRALLRVQRRHPHEEPFTELVGHRRFERAASLMLGGILAPEAEPEDSVVAEHLRLAGLPSAVMRIDGTEDGSAIGRLQAWWGA